MQTNPVKTALISVYNKDGVIDFARELEALNITIFSTGGTYEAIKAAGIEVEYVADVTGSPEILGGRVKTLHPKIHGGILARRNEESDIQDLEQNKISLIDLVVINFYPFEEAVEKDGTEEEIIEQIDIGGPTMLRSAAKNFKWVTPVYDPSDYSLVIQELQTTGGTSLETRQKLAGKAFERIAHYDDAIQTYFRKINERPELLNLNYEKVSTLRYGENPHHKAAFFRNPNNSDSNVTNAKVLHGKQLSFNNIVDADSALELVKEFSEPTATFIKHNNPCGVASSATIEHAFELAHDVDSLSAYGCVIALNRPCNKEIVAIMKAKKMFVELIIAPRFDDEALAILQKNPNIRLLEVGDLKVDKERRDIKKVAGGILIQTIDAGEVTKADLQVVSKTKPSDDQIEAMLFANKVAKRVMSNAIVFAKKLEDGSLVTTGIGAGQMSRVDSVWIASKKGGENVKGSVMASDAFLPFADAAEEAYKAGIVGLIQPGGSIRDDVVLEYTDSVDMIMVFTGKRFFRH